MSSGWIKIHRTLLEWEWYDDNNTKILFLHLLLKANHKDKRYRGKLVKQGSLLTSREQLSIETNLSVQQVRTSLTRLKSTNEITIISTRQGTEIQVNKYSEYQLTNQPANQQLTNEQPTANQQVTSNKNVKNIKKERNITSAYAFDSFWSAYGKKVGRTVAEAKWNKLKESEREAAMQAVGAYVKSTPDVQYRKNAATWINQRCWEDEIEPKQLTSSALLEASGLNPDGTFKI